MYPYIMVTINKIIQKNPSLEFIINLDKKLHYTTKYYSDVYGEGIFDNYTNKKINVNELNELLRIVKKENLILCPIKTNYGFSVGFEVHKFKFPFLDKGPDKTETLLKFKENQLPEGYNFNKLSKYFMRKENLAFAKTAGLGEIVNCYTEYCY